MAGEMRDQAAGFQEILRKLAMIHEGFVRDTARLELDLARTSALDPKTAALIVVGVAVAIGASSACASLPPASTSLRPARFATRSPVGCC